MVRAGFPQGSNQSISSNTNYPPQNSGAGSNESIFDDEDVVIGATRESCQYVIGIERASVDFMVTI